MHVGHNYKQFINPMVGGIVIVEEPNKCKRMGWYVASEVVLNDFPTPHGKFQAFLFPTLLEIKCYERNINLSI